MMRPNIIYEDETYGCTECLDPDCQQIEMTDGQFVPRSPCYSPIQEWLY